MNFNLISYVVSFLTGALLSFIITSDYYKLQIKEIESYAYQLNIDNLDSTLSLERDNYEFFSKKDLETSHEIKDIDISYNNAVNSLFSDNSSDKAVLSESSPTSSPVSESQCECSCKNRAKLQRLYEQQLMIARDCDINAVYLNQLIDLYNKVNQ